MGVKNTLHFKLNLEQEFHWYFLFFFRGSHCSLLNLDVFLPTSALTIFTLYLSVMTLLLCPKWRTTQPVVYELYSYFVIPHGNLIAPPPPLRN